MFGSSRALLHSWAAYWLGDMPEQILILDYYSMNPGLGSRSEKVDLT